MVNLIELILKTSISKHPIDFLDRIPVGKLGFYTDDPDVFEARIAEIEADLDEVEAGFEDPEKWVTSEQMHQDFLKMFTLASF